MIYYTEIQLNESGKIKWKQRECKTLAENEYFYVIDDLSFTTLSKGEKNSDKTCIEKLYAQKIEIDSTEFDNYIYGFLFTFDSDQEKNLEKVKKKMVEYINCITEEKNKYNINKLKGLSYNVNNTRLVKKT